MAFRREMDIVSFSDEEIVGAMPPPPQSVRVRDLMRRLGGSKADRIILKDRLETMAQDGLIVRMGARRYGRANDGDVITGTLSVTRRGFGFIALDGGGPDVYVRGENLGSAMHRDRVQAQVYEGSRGRQEGRVTKVLEAGTQTFVGYVHQARKAQWVTPRDERLPDRIILKGAAEHGQLIAAQMTLWPGPGGQTAEARVLKVFAEDGPASQETDLLIYDLGLPIGFSEEALAEVESESADVLCDDSLRTDLREKPFFTVDPKSARDFDDAVCAEALPTGGWVLYIAVADVAQYVRAGTSLDEDAYARSFSVYLPDRVIPMLPDRLSADLCSLRPDVDRYAMVVRIEVSPQGEFNAYSVMEAVIRSQKRLSYDQCGAALGLIDDPNGLLAPDASELSPIESSMTAVLDVSRVLRARRRRTGYLALEIPEPKVVLGSDGLVSSVVPYSRHEAHLMVEEAMLAANEAVARFFVERELESIFRVHAPPPEKGLERLQVQAEALNIALPKNGKAGALSQAIKGYSEHQHAWLINMLLLRSMARAEYSASCDGHYGLGLDAYLHFTSPIRRYSDLMVHREVKALLRDHASEEEDLGEIARHCSRRERLVLDAEREVIGLYKAMYMKDMLGDELPAVISGMTANGLFIYFETTHCDGFIPMSEIKQDWFELDETGTRITGRNTGSIYRLGDRLLTEVSEVSIQKRRVTARCLGPLSEGE